MSKKNSHISDDELYETTEQLVDSTPDTITTENDDQNTTTPDNIDETPVMDENPVISDSETPVVENSISDATDETSVVDEQNPTPVVENPTPDATDETPVNEEVSDTVSTDDEKSSDKEPVKLNEFKRFNIRFGYSIDSRSSTTRRTLSTTEIVKQFVKAPTCFIAFETKEDVKDFETLLKIKTIKVEDKEGKLVDFSDAAKKHLIERVTELSKYWISRNSK